MLKCFSKRVRLNERNVIVETCLHFKYIITLHVVATSRTKNTARSNPIVLTQATLADHIQAIAASADVENIQKPKRWGVTSPPGWMCLNLKTLKLLNIQKLFQKRVTHSP